ncbi:MAG: hypothetical protein ACTSV2_03725 [Candidatus Thorarchaeota archaeon]
MKPIESDDSQPSADDALEREVDEMIESTDRDYSSKAKEKRKSRRITQKNKGYVSGASFVAWIVFASVFLLFFAVDYGIFENIAIVASALIVVMALNALFWIPASAGPQGSGARTKLSTILGFGWLIFVIMWWPFYGEFFSVYQNYAITLLSTVIVLILVGGVFISVTGAGDMGRESSLFTGVFIGWFAFLILWLWFYAGSYILNQNIAIVLLSFVVVLVIVGGVLRSAFSRSEEGPDSWRPLVVFICWLLFLSLWFWMFAVEFNDYQNVGIFILSLLATVGIGYAVSKRKFDKLDSLDFDND